MRHFDYATLLAAVSDLMMSPVLTSGTPRSSKYDEVEDPTRVTGNVNVHTSFNHQFMPGAVQRKKKKWKNHFVPQVQIAKQLSCCCTTHA
jgi:hypothetical protein